MTGYTAVKYFKFPHCYMNIKSQDLKIPENNCKNHLEEIKRLKKQRVAMEDRNNDLKNKIDLLEKEDKKIIDKIFFIKNLQNKVKKARDNVKKNRREKEELKRKRLLKIEAQKRKNFEFKKANASSVQKIRQRIQEEKSRMYKEGCALKEMALQSKNMKCQEKKRKAELIKFSKGMGKLWLELQNHKRIEEMSRRLEEQKEAELDKLYRQEHIYIKNKEREKLVMNNYQRDQEYQERILEEFKQTINKGER